MEPGSALRVLVIDANAHIRRLIATLLGALSIKDVAQARSPEAAVAMMLDKIPDLVIVDWAADATEALLFVHRLRQGELGDRRLPILALSPSTHHAVLEQAWEAGIDEVIAKPISALELIHRAGEMIESRLRLDRAVVRAAAE
jgi:two-component system phosphate regulon response regulator PhoB